MQELDGLKDVSVLCKVLFKHGEKPLQLTSYQHEIVDTILYERTNRFQVCAATQCGKSYSVAIAILLASILKDKKVLLIAPRTSQTHIISRYVIDKMFDSQLLYSQLAIYDKGEKIERLKKTASRSYFNFKNGGEIRFMSANITGGALAGENLLGFNGDMVVIEESQSIPDSIYYESIKRMLGATGELVGENRMLIEIGTPHVRNHFYKTWTSGKYKTLRVDWKLAMKEKIFTQEYIDERRAELSEFEFNVWYDAIFPAMSGDTSFFPIQWVEDCFYNGVEVVKGDDIYIGVDIGSTGIDKTVITTLKKTENKISMVKVAAMSTPDTSVIEEKVKEIAMHYAEITGKPVGIAVDRMGVGDGPYNYISKLPAKTAQVHGFRNVSILGSSNRFVNSKTKVAWRVRDMLQNKTIELLRHSDLYRDFSTAQLQKDTTGRVRLIDSKEKSPDFLDSLLYACYAATDETALMAGITSSFSHAISNEYDDEYEDSSNTMGGVF